MDRFTRSKRSEIMRSIGGKNTQPEILVRSLLHRMGFRFRIHKKELPGKPDVVLSRHKKVVFVNGCFWHGHKHCPRAKLPETRRAFWSSKIEGNIRRDARNVANLRDLGYKSIVVWTCQIKDVEALRAKLERFMKRTN